MIAIYEDWVGQYPIISIEDGLAEDDWHGWKRLTAALGRRVQLVGDDVFVTNPAILRAAASSRASPTALLVKLNQIGTVTRDARSDRHGARSRVRQRHLPSLRRNRRHHDRRSGRRDRCRPDQDRLGQPHGSHRQVQPAAAHRRARSARRRRSPGAAVRQKPESRSFTGGLTCIASSCSATAKAPGTRKTGSPAGPTSTCREKGREEARGGRPTAAGRGLRLRRRLHLGAQARDPHAVDRARRDWT